MIEIELLPTEEEESGSQVEPREGEDIITTEGDEGTQTEEPVYELYNDLISKGYIDKLEELPKTEEEAIKAAMVARESSAIAKYKGDLPKSIQMYQEAMELGGEATAENTDNIQKLNYISSIKLAGMDEEQLKAHFNAFSTDEQDPEVQAAIVDALIKTGTLLDRTQVLADRQKESLTASIEKAKSAFKEVKESNVKKGEEVLTTYYKTIEDSTKILDIELDDTKKEAMKNFVKVRPHKDATKQNPLTTNDFTELLKDPKVQAKIALMATYGIFKEDSKFSLAAKQKKVKSVTTQQNNNQDDDIEPMSLSDFNFK